MTEPKFKKGQKVVVDMTNHEFPKNKLFGEVRDEEGGKYRIWMEGYLIGVPENIITKKEF